MTGAFSSGKAFYPRGTLGKGGIKALQTAQGPKPSPFPKSVTACPPLEQSLSATDAAEGGAQLPNTLTTGNGNTSSSGRAATHREHQQLGSPVLLLRNIYGGTIKAEEKLLKTFKPG